MPLYIRDPEVDGLVERLVTLKQVTKTEAVRQALRNEVEREQQRPDLVEQTAEFVRRLQARANPEKGLPADKAFIDSLYEDD